MTQTEALIAIAKRDGGLITPAAVIEEARDPDSVLHGAFTWDDTKAAAKWRVHEAQQLIRECRISVDEKNKTVKTYAFIGVSSDRNGAAADNPYRLSFDVGKRQDLLAVAEMDVLDQLKALKGRYSHIKRLERVWDAIDEVMLSLNC